jgi:hypothetical protein
MSLKWANLENRDFVKNLKSAEFGKNGAINFKICSFYALFTLKP